MDTNIPIWRSQVVATEGIMSDSVSVQSGVPQGLVLGPSLFLYYMNDIHEEGLKSTVRLFADDTIAYLVDSDADCDTLQCGLDKLALWEKMEDGVPPNYKSQVLTISRKRKQIHHN